VFVCVLSAHSLNFIDEKSWTEYGKHVELNYLSSTEISAELFGKILLPYNNLKSIIIHRVFIIGRFLMLFLVTDTLIINSECL